MNIFPYISSYLLVYSFSINLIFWFMPAPYGKFSYHKHNCIKILNIPSILFNYLIHIGFVTFFVGYLDDNPIKFYNGLNLNNRGWAVFIWLSLYYLLKIFVNTIYPKDEITRGTKMVNLLWTVPYLLFWAPAGFYLRRAVNNIIEPLYLYDYVLILLGAVFLIMNLYSDILKNEKRKMDDVKTYAIVGKYLNQDQIYNDFYSLRNLFLPPNYILELCHWFIFIFVCRKWESLWFSCCIFSFLFTRGIWQKKWYDEPLQNEKVEKLNVKNKKITF